MSERSISINKRLGYPRGCSATFTPPTPGCRACPLQARRVPGGAADAGPTADWHSARRASSLEPPPPPRPFLRPPGASRTRRWLPPSQTQAGSCLGVSAFASSAHGGDVNGPFGHNAGWYAASPDHSGRHPPGPPGISSSPA